MVILILPASLFYLYYLTHRNKKPDTEVTEENMTPNLAVKFPSCSKQFEMKKLAGQGRLIIKGKLNQQHFTKKHL